MTIQADGLFLTGDVIQQAFDELLLLKRGGETIYCGPLGDRSKDLVQYFSVQSLAYFCGR